MLENKFFAFLTSNVEVTDVIRVRSTPEVTGVQSLTSLFFQVRQALRRVVFPCFLVQFSIERDVTTVHHVTQQLDVVKHSLDFVKRPFVL